MISLARKLGEGVALAGIFGLLSVAGVAAFVMLVTFWPLTVIVGIMIAAKVLWP